MSNIQLYYKNTTQDAVGSEHGIRPEDLDSLADRLAEITDRLAVQRLPYRQLPYQQAMVEEVKRLTEQIRGRFDNLVVLGIGGSALGNIALQTALNDPFYNLRQRRNGPRLFVMDNVDPVQFASLLDILDGQLDRTCFNVISKSGQTAETAAQLLIVWDLLRRRLPLAHLADQVIATTSPDSGVLRQVATEQNLRTLEVPPGVGGRFSVLSQVGLFSAAMCNIDIDQLLLGARAMDERVKEKNLRQNPAALYAAIQYLFYQKKKNLSVMMPYSYQLKDLCDWYRQLWAESLGKEKTRDGQVVHAGPTPIKALGATDQHSQVQLYREGPHDKVFTFLEVEHFARDVVIGQEENAGALAYLGGQSLAALMNSEKLATEYALVQSQRPCLTVLFPEISAYTVGQFLYLFEVATSYMGELLNIEAYDQPAVELGKDATRALMGHPEYQELLKNILPYRDRDEDYLV
ncbi:MAG: glucose-6-phosphate isomerase [Sedimentisphaerales bacterium]|nr:glucose-6-phosphate isomerase [Sedimentisphaerales bacterium]